MNETSLFKNEREAKHTKVDVWGLDRESFYSAFEEGTLKEL